MASRALKYAKAHKAGELAARGFARDRVPTHDFGAPDNALADREPDNVALPVGESV